MLKQLLLGLEERLPGLASLLSSLCAHLLLAWYKLGRLPRLGSDLAVKDEQISVPVPGSTAAPAERAAGVVGWSIF